MSHSAMTPLHYYRGEMASPWTHDAIQPRPLTGDEEQALRNCALARQQVRNAVALMRSLSALLPEGHSALDEAPLIASAAQDFIVEYIDYAADKITELPEIEAQEGEDNRYDR